MGWYREDGSLIAYPERCTLNALLHAGFIHPQQTPDKEGGEFTAYKLTDKGLRFAKARGEKMASIDEFFWTILHKHDGAHSVYIHVGKTAPDLSAIIDSDFKIGDEIIIGCHDVSDVPSEALQLTDDKLESQPSQ